MPISFDDFKKRLNTIDTAVVDKAVTQIDSYCKNNPGDKYEYSTREIAERDALWWSNHSQTEQALLEVYSAKGWSASIKYSKPGSSWDSFTYILFKLTSRD